MLLRHGQAQDAEAVGSVRDHQLEVREVDGDLVHVLGVAEPHALETVVVQAAVDDGDKVVALAVRVDGIEHAGVGRDPPDPRADVGPQEAGLTAPFDLLDVAADAVLGMDAGDVVEGVFVERPVDLHEVIVVLDGAAAHDTPCYAAAGHRGYVLRHVQRGEPWPHLVQVDVLREMGRRVVRIPGAEHVLRPEPYAEIDYVHVCLPLRLMVVAVLPGRVP